MIDIVVVVIVVIVVIVVAYHYASLIREKHNRFVIDKCARAESGHLETGVNELRNPIAFSKRAKCFFNEN